MSENLYEIADEYLALDRRIEEDLEFYGAISAGTFELIESTGTSLGERIEAYLTLAESHDARARMIREQEERLAAIRRPLQRKAEALRNYVFGAMKRADLKRHKGLIEAVICKNSRPTVEVRVNPMSLPAVYRNETLDIQPDRDALLAAWKDGLKLPPGVEVIEGEHLRVR